MLNNRTDHINAVLGHLRNAKLKARYNHKEFDRSLDDLFIDHPHFNKVAYERDFRQVTSPMIKVERKSVAD